MPAATVELVTKAEYARRRGVTEGAVRQAVRDGRITEVDGKIDPAAADEEWARNSRVRAGSAPSEPNAEVPGDEADRPASDAWQYQVSRARREQAEAQIAELKLQEQLGQLVRVDSVRSEVAAALGQVREHLLQLPARLAPLIVAEPDQAQIQRLLEAEIRAALAKAAALERAG